MSSNRPRAVTQGGRHRPVQACQVPRNLIAGVSFVPTHPCRHVAWGAPNRVGGMGQTCPASGRRVKI